MQLRVRRLGIGCLLVALTAAGCARDFAQIRQDQTARWSADLDNRTASALAQRTRLSLARCIEIALEHNLAIRAAAIEREVAGLERRVSFANFLPRVDLSATQQWRRYHPTATIAGTVVPIADRRVRDTAISLQQPVFAPYTWYLYRMYRTGEQLQGLVLERTRQQITLQVTALFYHVLVLEEADRYLAAQVAQARELAREIGRRREFDLARAGEVAETEALLCARQRDRDANQRALRQVRSELLAAMGLDPFASLRLQETAYPCHGEEALADLVLEALLNRPEVQVRDRQYAMAQDRIKMAITAFLPELSAFGAFSHTSDSFVRYQSQWLGGFGAVMTAFNGFANLNAYRAARKRAEKIYVQQEQACLMVMLQVQEAWLNLHTAQQDAAVAAKLLHARGQQQREQAAAWQQQLVTLSERLAADVRLDEARLQAAATGYARQVAAATLDDVVGRSLAAQPDTQGDE